MNTVPAISRDDFDRSKNPLFQISVRKPVQVEDSDKAELLLDDGRESLRDLALKLWELSSTRDRLPSTTDMLGEKWAHFSRHSLTIDLSGKSQIDSLPSIELDQIGEDLRDLVSEGAKAEELSELLLVPLSEALKTLQPVSFEFGWGTGGRDPREFQAAVLPFGYSKIRSIMIVIEESAKPTEAEGEYVLDLDESSILNDEDGKSGHSSSASGNEDNLDLKKSARAVNDRSPHSVSDLISEARVSAKDAQEAEERSRKALYAALSRSYDLARCAAKTPEIFAAQLIFGHDCSESKMNSYIAVLAAALSQDIPEGELGNFLQGLDGGIESLIEANRRGK